MGFLLSWTPSVGISLGRLRIAQGEIGKDGLQIYFDRFLSMLPLLSQSPARYCDRISITKIISTQRLKAIVAKNNISDIASNIFEGDNDFLCDLKERISQAQVRVAIALNTELVLLNLQIGRDILTRQQQQGWGAKVINRLATDLRSAFPEMKGFSPRNLKYMRAFAETYPDEQIVQEVLAQITWYHNIALLEFFARRGLKSTANS